MLLENVVLTDRSTMLQLRASILLVLKLARGCRLCVWVRVPQVAMLKTCPNTTLPVERNVKPQLWPTSSDGFNAFISRIFGHGLKSSLFYTLLENKCKGQIPIKSVKCPHIVISPKYCIFSSFFTLIIRYIAYSMTKGKDNKPTQQRVIF